MFLYVTEEEEGEDGEIEDGLRGGGGGGKRLDSTVDDDDDDVYYMNSQGLGSNPGCCDRCCVRWFPSGFTRELKAMFTIGWPIVSINYRLTLNVRTLSISWPSVSINYSLALNVRTLSISWRLVSLNYSLTPNV